MRLLYNTSNSMQQPRLWRAQLVEYSTSQKQTAALGGHIRIAFHDHRDHAPVPQLHPPRPSNNASESSGRRRPSTELTLRTHSLNHLDGGSLPLKQPVNCEIIVNACQNSEHFLPISSLVMTMTRFSAPIVHHSPTTYSGPCLRPRFIMKRTFGPCVPDSVDTFPGNESAIIRKHAISTEQEMKINISKSSEYLEDAILRTPCNVHDHVNI